MLSAGNPPGACMLSAGNLPGACMLSAGNLPGACMHGMRSRLLRAPAHLQTADYETMARALATIGACDEAVSYDA